MEGIICIMEEYNISLKDLAYIIVKHKHNVNKKKISNKKYNQSEKGKAARHKCQKKYYHIKKDKYHPIYNPTGSKIRKVRTKKINI